MIWNQNSGYGRIQMDQIFGAAPTLGKTLIVVPPTDPNSSKLGVLFPNDPDAQTRYFTSIQDAHDYGCESGRGDVIAVAPGTYEENVEITKDYVQIVGITLPGYARPDIAPEAGSAVIASTCQGFGMKHVRAVSEDDDSVEINGNGWYIDDCVLDGTSGQAATEGCLRLVGDADDDSYTASEGILSNSLVRGSTSGAGIIFQHAANPSGVGVSDVQVRGCRFYGNGVDFLSAVSASGGGAGIFTNLLVQGNYFLTVGAAYVYMDMDQGAAGDLAANSALICDNYFADEALIAAQIDISGQPNVMFVGNYDAAGLVDGSTFNN